MTSIIGSILNPIVEPIVSSIISPIVNPPSTNPSNKLQTGASKVATPFNWYQTSGIPSDSVGTTGDFAFDTTGNFFWGPKTTTWVGTARASNGPTGATGPAGPVATQGYGDFQGPSAAFTTAVTLSSTYQNLYTPGTTTVATYTPKNASYLIGGAVAINSGTATIRLYDQTAGVAIWTSSSFGPASIFPIGPLPVNTTALGGYPLVAGNTVVWQAMGSGSGLIQIDPIYYDICTAPTIPLAVSTITNFSYTAALTGTNKPMYLTGGSPSYARYIRVGKPAYLYQVTITNSGTSGYALVYCSLITSTATVSTTLTPIVDVGGGLYAIPAGTTWTSPIYGMQYLIPQNNNYGLVVSGTSNGPVSATVSLLQ